MMVNLPSAYDKRTFFWSLFGLALLCGAMKVTNGAGFALLFLPILVGFAKNKPAVLLYSLLATAMLTMTNPFLASKGMVFSFEARFVYLIVGGVLFLQMVGQRKSKYVMPLGSMMFYIAYMAVVSMVGWQPIISYLKLILFLIIFLAFLSVANVSATKIHDAQGLRSVMLCFACFLILGSLCLIPFPAIGKMGAAKAIEAGYSVESIGLFMGVMIQPQALGPAVAVFSTVLFADLLWSIRRWDKLYVALLLGAPVLVYYTSSRTAMGTYLAGMMFVGFVFLNAHMRDRMAARWKTRALSALFVAGLVACLALFATPQTRDAVLRFALKTGEVAVKDEQRNFDRLVGSRRGLFEQGLENFKESPVIGNGFQVSKEMSERTYTSPLQLLSARIEKGVWVTAVLEEGGAFGFLIFLILLFYWFGKLLQRRAFIGASALFVLIISNFGEFTLFSLSGTGGLIWAVVFLGLVLDAQREQQALLAPGFRPGFCPLQMRGY